MTYLRRIVALMRRAWRTPSIWLAWWLSQVRSRDGRVQRVWDGPHALAGASHVALLVHYDRHGRFLKCFQYLTAALEEAGFAVVVVTNSPKIDQASLDQTLQHCGAIIHRQNVGFDFGAWHEGLNFLNHPTDLECLLLINDSVFGPLYDFQESFKKCDFGLSDVWGMTDSYDRRYHLQSYFLMFGPTALANPAFQDFWRNMRYINYKPAVSRFHEIGFSQKLLSGGLRIRALFPYTQIVETVVDQAIATDDKTHPLRRRYLDLLLSYIISGTPLNQTHYFWEFLITEARCPFLKRELIERNPVSIPFIVNWRSTLRQSTDYPVELIEEYLQISARNRIF